MKDNTYIVIQSWMVTELNLSGNDLLVYAIIYGFSQDGESRFTGSRQYLADWCNCSVRTIQTILNNLTERGIIIKYEGLKNNVKYCEYSAQISPPVKKFHGPSEKISRAPSEKISLYNIDNNNIDNNIDNSNTINSITTETSGNRKSLIPRTMECFSDDKNIKVERGRREAPVARDPSRKKQNLFDKCLEEINNFTNIAELREALITYLKMRLEVKDKPLHGVNMWKGMLNKLDKVANETGQDYIAIVNQSIDKAWLTFYPLSTNKKRDIFSEYGAVSCEENIEETFIDEDF